MRAWRTASKHSQTGRYGEARRLYEAACAAPRPSASVQPGASAAQSGTPSRCRRLLRKCYLAAGAEGSETNRRKTELLGAGAKRGGHATPRLRRSPSTVAEPASQPTASTGSAGIEPSPASGTEQPEAAVQRKRWLWTAVSAAAVGIGVGLGVGLGTRRPDPQWSGRSDAVLVAP